MLLTFVHAPLWAGTGMSWQCGWPNTMIIDGAP
jgi:hypothetical protein